MKCKQDVKKALWSSTILMYVIYAFVGRIPSVIWGWNRPDNVLNELHGDFFGRAANLTLFIASGTDFLITSVSLNQRVQEIADPQFDPTDWGMQSNMKWFLYTLPSFTIGFLLLCFIPDLATLAGLMTAFVVPFSQIIGPAALSFIASRRGIINPLAVWEWIAIFVGFAVGICMLIFGIAATIASVLALPAPAGNFFCDAVAE